MNYNSISGLKVIEPCTYTGMGGNMVNANIVSSMSKNYTEKVDLHKKENCSGVDCVFQCTNTDQFEDFKREIWEEINAMPWHRGVNISIFITEDAFKRMMHDTAFKEEMMTVLQQECLAARPPIETSMNLITEKGYAGYSDIKQENKSSSFQSRHKEREAFYRKKAQKKKMYDEIWEKKRKNLKLFQEKYEKDLENREFFTAIYEKQLWNRRMVIKRYEANEIYQEDKE